MKKIIQIPLSDEEAQTVLMLQKIVKMADEIIEKMKSFPEYRGGHGAVKKWQVDALTNTVGCKNMAQKELGELLCKLHLERGKVL